MTKTKQCPFLLVLLIHYIYIPDHGISKGNIVILMSSDV